MEYNIISSDGHIDLEFLAPDLFISNAPAGWREKMPQVVETEEGFEWRASGKFLSTAYARPKAILSPENEDRMDRMAAVGFYEDAQNGRPHPSTLELRLKDMEMDGVDADVIYGLTFTAGRLLGVRRSEGKVIEHTPDTELVTHIFRIYNDWLADFCSQSPDRVVGISCIPNHDPGAAAAELRRTASLGLRGAELDVQGAGIPVYYEEWDVLWKAAAECNIPISFHVLGVNPRPPNPGDEGIEEYTRTFSTLGMALGQLEGPELLTSIILSGAVERFPDFKFVLGECGASWVPFVLDRLDHECPDYPGLTMKPSDYWRRQGYTTYQSEGFIPELIQFIGEDNVMWGSDYPHPDGVWPDSQAAIKKDLKNLKDENIRRKILRDTCAKLYGFKI